MDSNGGNQRKRGGRLNKNASSNEPISPTSENELADVSAVAISPTLEEVVGTSPSVPAASECRRSSRKKIIKFDVRDLLNKNRKTHKIQIEARIDSNAPSTSKASTAKGSEVANSAAASTVRQDMLSKQKTFLEKSAIFRRYSISQEHKPPPLPLPMPPPLGKANDNKETVLSAASSTRRLSRTQEFFSNVMIKPKQTTSLIVAQIESNTPSSSTTTTTTKRRSVNKSVETEVKGVGNLLTEVQPQVVQQRKRGRPARIKVPASMEPTTPTSTKYFATSKKITPEKAKNWKEYKACLAQQHGQTTETLPAEDKVVEHITADDTIMVASKPNKIAVHENVEKANQQSEHEMILDIPKTVDNVEVEELELKSEDNVKPDQLQIESESQNQEESLNINKPSQKLQEDSNLLGKTVQNREISATNNDQIELNTESEQTKDIETKSASGSKQTIHNTRHQLKNKVAEILTVDDKEEKLPETQDELENPEEFIELSPEIIAEIMEESVQSIIEIDSHSYVENNEKVLQATEASLQESLTTTDTTLKQPSTPTTETIATYSHTSSSSESENASEHSSSSSAPSSASSSAPSSRSYKSNDKLRVTVKRLSLPKSPSTSSQTSTSEELNPNVLRKKPPVAKRSKRLQKKFFEKLDDQSSFESIENTASLSSLSMDNKFEIERPASCAGNTSECLEKEEQLSNTSVQMAKEEASVIEKVSTRKSLRIHKDNISESSDEYQSRETATDKQLSVREPISKDIQHEQKVECSEEQHIESKPNETEIQPATEEQQGEIQQQTSDQNATVVVEKQENVSDLVEYVVQEEHVPTEYSQEVLVQDDLEQAKNNADISSTVAAELTVSTAEEEVDPKIENISCDAKGNTTDAVKLSENITELDAVIQAESSNTSQSCISDTLDVHTPESNDKKSISEKETVSSTKRKSLRQQKDKNVAAEVSTASETDSPNTELINEQNVKDTAKVLPKRRARKSRFKNLHDSEIESETDSSGTGKQTPIEEYKTLMPTKLNEIEENIAITKTQNDELEQEVNPVIEEVIIEEIAPQSVFESEEKSNSEAIEVDNVTEEYTTASSNLLSSHIQNVSIETNTLLDILRRVQSNTEAALKASKSTKDTTTVPILNEETTRVSSETIQQDMVLRTSNEDDSVSKESSATREVDSPLTQMSPTRLQSSSSETHKQIKGADQTNTETALESFTKDPVLVKESTNESEETSKEADRASKTSSPTRYEVESPLTLKDVKQSTSHSPTASPSVLKKSRPSKKSDAETALKSNKSAKDSSPTLCTESTNEGEAIIEEQAKSDVISQTRCEADSPLTLKGLQKSPSRSRTSSPLITQKKSKRSMQSKTDAALVNEVADNTEQKMEVKEQDKPLIASKLVESEPRSIVESPLTLKSIPISPSRSQTSSPLIHKKSKRNGGQASTEAVLEANKSAVDSSATLVDTTEQIKETIPEAEVLSSSKKDEPKRCETESPLTLKDVHPTSPSRSKTASPSSSKKSKRSQQSNTERSKNSTPTEVKESVDNTEQIKETIQQAEVVSTSKSNSPTRCEAESPLTLKGVQISPTRSQSASPLTYLKSKCSPTRSNSSSPLTLKKVTRRYERRSRRGDDSTHKTLEETFAEIAAQSTQAVLAAKGIDIAEEEAADNKTLLNEAQAMASTLETFSETPPPIAEETIVEGLEAEATDIMENLLDAIPVEGVVNDDSTPLECEQTSQECNINETKKLENILEQQEISKAAPARRGRKPKNRPSDVPKETGDEQNLSEKENDDDKAKESNAPPLSAEDLEINTVSKIESKESNTDLEQQTTTAEVADSKVCKTSNKKRNTTKELQEADADTPELVADEGSKPNAEDDVVRSPTKQLTKKRDSSQNKAEIKSNGKAKLTKKGRNNEEERQSVVQKDDNNPSIAVSTTPPATKRGRKPKNQQETTPPSSSSGSKRKTKKDIAMDNNNKEEDINEVNTSKMVDSSENESKADASDKTLDEKLAKKKRQKKLKEAFEAALADDLARNKEAMANLDSKADTSSLYGGVNSLDQAPTSAAASTSPTNIKDESTKITCITPVETEEDPDPLKDIEKFIADGVNLLKKDYKLDEDSVDDVLTANTTKTTADNISETTKTTDVDIKAIVNTFETPADTPINTPSVTPPPKSPTSQLDSSVTDENSGVRRSHRIKLITKTPKALVGRGLVRDKERFSIKDDVETKIHYTLDDHLTGLAEVEAKNAKFLKDMEERLSNFHVIKENEYLCERVVSREAKKMICDCFLTHEEEERGELGCGEDCLNRLLMIECGPDCNVKERCTNKRFQKLLCSPCRVFRTEKKGFGIMADIEILPGEFIMEYVGEVIDTDEFEKRRIMYSQDKNRHYYFMALRSDAIIDATIKGNISRFINHSCDPNAETQKWTVNGELRIGFFSRKSIMPGEEITFNYQYQRYGREAQRCYCESANCRGWIGQEPASDEGEQIDDEDDESEDDDDEEGEEADASNLLVHDDDEDSDASVADPEEVQKQLEMAAAQAEVELAPLKLLAEKDKKAESQPTEEKVANETNKPENEEDSKSKFKKLLSKMAEKVAAKHKQNKREQKMQRKKKSKESSADLANKLKFSEDPDIEDEVEFLKECGLKNQSDTLRLSRLMVRAKLIETRLNLLEILRKGDLPCRRLFLDYHGLRLLHGWMSEDAGNMQIRLALLQTLETLPIANKTVLTDSKVMQAVRNWCGNHATLSPNEDSSSSNSNSQDTPTPTAATATVCVEEGTDLQELQKLALKLVTTWEGLPEIFRIPKKERIEQMKEHEREADRQYAANAETSETTADNDRYRRDRFGRVGGGGGGLNSFNNTSNRFVKPNNGNPLRTTTGTTPENIKNLSKAQRREMFAAKVARDEAEKRLNEERREFETKCRFFGLDPKKTRPQDVPFCVNPATGQWFSIERKPITTPPSYAHVQVPVKPKSTDPKDYQLPGVCATLPPQWKYAITPQGKIYYYHIKYRVPQWEPPTATQLQQCENEEDDDSESEYTNTTGEESTDDEDDILIGMDATQLKAYIDRKVEARRQKRYQRLVDERAISPRREEDRIYNQIEVRKYKENKEKIRKRKEEIRRKRAEALRQSSLNMCTLGSLTETSATANVVNKLQTESDEELGALPIQDYLISSDEEDDIKAEVNSPLIDRIVEGDKIVDELDALTTKRQLKRPLPPHRDLSEPSTSSVASGLNPAIARQEYKKRKLEKKEKRKPKEQDAKYRKNKEKFRCEIAGIIVHHLKPYRKDTCTVGRIQSNEDFNHLARKLTHFVMIKELKYCESVGQTLVVTESVKSKSREFIKKYMAKYGDVYVKPTNDPEFKDIPFTL